jgi:hypothetical protein
MSRGSARSCKVKRPGKCETVFAVCGLIGLIGKGSGLVVGAATVTDCLPPLSTLQEYVDTEPQHRISLDQQPKALFDGWHTPWVLANAEPLFDPVPYRHPMGAVIWVDLNEEVSGDVMKQLNAGRKIQNTRRVIGRDGGTIMKPEVVATTAASPTISLSATPVREVRLTGGNIRNNHIYLPLDFFPADGMEWPETKERFARLREALALIRRLWNQERVSFQGDITFFAALTKSAPLTCCASSLSLN